jgi:hypothetical protein
MSGKRPVSIAILGSVYIAIGAIGFAYHLSDSLGHPNDGVWIEPIELLALVAGVFLLQGHNWARWLALGWIAFHVVLSAFHTLQEFAIHSVFCLLIAWLLFRPAAARYFRGRELASAQAREGRLV